MAFLRYIQRKAKHVFRKHAAASADEATELVRRASDDVEVMRRQALVYSLYHAKHKSVMVCGVKLMATACYEIWSLCYIIVHI